MPGTGFPSGPAMTTVSPMAKISGWPDTVRSGRTCRRPARSASAPSHSAAGEARTPAAQIRVLACRGWLPCPAPSGLNQHDARLVGIDMAEVGRQRVLRQFGNGAGEFDAGWAGADNDEGQKCRAPLRIG